MAIDYLQMYFIFFGIFYAFTLSKFEKRYRDLTDGYFLEDLINEIRSPTSSITHPKERVEEIKYNSIHLCYRENLNKLASS